MSIFSLLAIQFMSLAFASSPTSAAQIPVNPSAMLFDSNISQPQLIRERRTLSDLTSSNKLEGRYVVIKSAEGKQCTFQPSQSDWSAGSSNECLLALQIYFSATKSVKFFQSLGIEIPLPVEITIQDPNTPRYAQADNRGISFTKFADQDLPKELALIVDITFHELTHVAQSLQQQRDQIIYSRLGISFVEGYANLFAYFLSGRTDLGVDESGLPGMRAHSDMWFGRTNFGRYDSIEPLTSVLVELHKHIDQKSRSTQREQTLNNFSRALMKSFYYVNKDSGLVDYFKIVMNQLDSESFDISSAEIRKKLISLLLARGFDLANPQMDGQVAGFVVNGLPVSASSSEKMERAQNAGTPWFQVQPGMMSDPNIHWPINVVLFEMSVFQNLGICMSDEFQKLSTQEMNDPNVANRLTMICIKKLAGSEVEIGNQIYSQLDYIIEKPGEVLRPTVKNNGKQCAPSQPPGLLVAWAFDRTGKKIGEFAFPSLCR